MTAPSVETAAALLGRAFAALGEVVADAGTLEVGLAALGWAPPPEVDLIAAFALDTSQVVAKLEAVLNSTADEQSDEALMIERYAELAEALVAVVGKIDTLASGLPASLSAAGDYAQKTNIVAELPTRLLDFVVVAGTHSVSPVAAALLALGGVFTFQHFDADDSIYQVDHVRSVVDSKQLALLVSDPASAFKKAYGWGTAAFDAERLLGAVGRLLQSLGGQATLAEMDASVQAKIGQSPTAADSAALPQLLVDLIHELGEIPVDAMVSLHRLRATAASGADTGLELAPYVRGAADLQIPLTEALVLSIDAAVDVEEGIGLALRPGDVRLRGGLLTGAPSELSGSLAAGLALVALPGNAPRPLLSAPGGVALTLSAATFQIGVADADGQAPDAYVRAAITGGKLVVGSRGADGFLQQQLPSTLEADFDVGVRWSQRSGLTFEGSTRLDWRQPLAVGIGPVRLDEIHVALGAVDEQIQLATSVTVMLAIGPVTATVQDVGAQAALTAARGNLGPLDLTIGFKPPSGVGVSVQADEVSGAGYLALDPATGTYAGAVDLSLLTLSLAAVGLVVTRLPGGSPGYSMLALVSVRFSPPIEIGFGFAIDGIGGLLGINRTIAIDPLRAGLQKGSLDSVLFPSDVMKNPQKVVSDLEQYFPSAPQQYLVGPMVEILWGEDAMFTASVGVFIEFPKPTRVTIVGQFRLALPTPQAAVAEIEMDVLGEIDFTAKLVAIDLALRNSRIAAFTLTGQGALRASWGQEAAFLLSLGGWNPSFTPPASFPPLSRLALALSQSANPLIRFEAYLAITSNTIQLGANVDLSASLDIPVIGTFGIAASLGFDALIELDPFGFVVDIHASVALTWNKKPFLAVMLDLTLSGPHPWHAVGKATFTCFGSHSVQFQFTTGDATALPAPSTVDGTAALLGELAKDSNWSAQLPPTASAGAVTGAAAQTGAVLVHPLGALTFRQKTMPLDIQITRIANVPLASGATTYSITLAVAGDGTAAVSFVTESFAPSQFLSLTDDQKLSRPSFEQHDAGFAIAPGTIAWPDGYTTEASANVEVHVLVADPDGHGGLVAQAPPVSSVRRPVGTALLARGRVTSAASTRATRDTGPIGDAAQLPIAVVPRTYAVVDRTLLNPWSDDASRLATYTVADEQRQAIGVGAQVVATSSAQADPDRPLAGLDPSAYYLLTSVNSGQCLAVLGGSTAAGASVVQQPAADAGSEFWRFEPVSVGTYRVVAEHSGMALAADAIGTANGTPVIQWSSVGGFNQEWHPVRVGPARYRIELVNAGRCLDVAGQSVSSGATVQLWDWWGGANQQWQLTRVSEPLLWHQWVRERAFERWQQEGRPLWTSALPDWLHASVDILTPIIAREAEARYERRGRGPGRDQEDWYAAVSEVVGLVAQAGNWPDELLELSIQTVSEGAVTVS